ncbi:acyl-CoA N-acyltransferase [Xylaria sp. FL0933]|nr:acyl-CoA N-acyltransferase [Xylaria sp. FL0933]
MHVPYVEQPHQSPPGYRVRDAELADVDSITNIWYTSFNPTHKFFHFATPDDAATRKWFNELWAMGIKAGPGVMRTFVVESLSQGNKLVAFSRWHVPQADGNQDIPMPPVPVHWDSEITDGLWGGMARSRARIMGKEPHWMAEFIAVDQAYQKRGLAFTLSDWGIRQADAEGLKIYGDASMKGLPVWKHYGCVERGIIRNPGRPGCFETYEVVPIVRLPKTKEVRELVKV